MTGLGNSAEKNICRANDLHRAVLEYQAKRSIGIEPGEAPTQCLVGSGVDAEPGPGKMCALLPCSHQRETLACTPQAKQPRKTSSKERNERRRVHSRAQSSARAASYIRCARKIDPKANDDAIAAALKQNPGKLLARQEQVVRPFKHERFARRCDVNRLDQRKSGSQGERRCGRVRLAQLDQRAAIEIAGGGDPVTSLTPFSGGLVEGNQPIPFDYPAVGEQIGIG